MPFFEVYQQKHTTGARRSHRQTWSFESLVSRLLDVMLFTSAIIITAYSYLTGTLPSTRPIEGAPLSLSSPPPPPLHKNKIIYRIEEKDLQKLKRTQAWAQEQIATPLACNNRKKRHSSASLFIQPKIQTPRDKKRTRSLSCLSGSNQEEVISRMEERLQSLIQQGQEALLSP
ncbi:hypothetical protein BY458DRAFT_508585 [Sporodiniella umbellata]|nr:hypothetical protein BY458DRAFT_508585 [Sporodiniella umbellata]